MQVQGSGWLLGDRYWFSLLPSYFFRKFISFLKYYADPAIVEFGWDGVFYLVLAVFYYLSL